jgi:hypothetical protein
MMFLPIGSSLFVSGVSSAVHGLCLGCLMAPRCFRSAGDALHPFSPTRTHSAVDPDEKYDVRAGNDALLSDRK